jgi:SAM-dependent methyltransferase
MPGVLVVVREAPLLGPLRSAAVPAADWEELTDCPICGRGEDVRDVAVVEGAELGAILAACVDCEHLFLRRRPRGAWLDAFYADDWDSVRGASGDGLAARRPRPADKVAGFCDSDLPDGARVLDIGAGLGDQLLGFRERGYEVHGVEPSGHRAAYVRDVVGIPCPQGSVAENELPGPADLVFSHHVLEHVLEPAEVIAGAAAALAPGGHTYVAVPNLWSEHPPQTFHFAPHLSQYTLRSLRRLLARHGFELVRSAEDRELQVLAVLRDGPVADVEPGDPEAFWARVGAWVEGAFGAATGRRVLVWCKSRDRSRLYDAKRVRTLQGRRIGLARAAMRRGHDLPRAVRRHVDPYASSSTLRLLEVDVRAEPPVLPVRVRYPDGPAPIWVK